MTASNRRSSLVWQVALVIGLCLALVALVSALGAFRKPASTHTITFRVEASAGVAVVDYADAYAQMSAMKQVSTPWTRKQNNPSGTEVYLIAGNPSQTGTLTCELLVDNRSWKKDTATSPGDKVACAGIVP